MIKYFTNTFSILNLHKTPSVKSEVVSQIIYGEDFSIEKKLKKWIKIKIKEDGYKGFIKKKKFNYHFKPTHKISVLKANVFSSMNKRKKTYELTFGSKIKVLDNSSNFFKFEKGWVNKSEVKPLNFKNKDIFKNITMFKGVKYKWGGKSYKGLDCSALIQLFLNYNNKKCPRDANDLILYFKNNINLERVKKNDILYWKSHVAVALSQKRLIHAYGPLKKTVIMNTLDTIKKINKTANLKLKKIKRIK